jgi:hypothetical protein
MMLEKSPHRQWLYLWLAISAAVNIVSLASLLDGLVTWADAFRLIINLYRYYIRDQIISTANYVFPPVPQVSPHFSHGPEDGAGDFVFRDEVAEALY